MEYVALINGLIPLVTNLGPIVAGIIGHIKKEQPGMSDDDILNHASLALTDEQKEIVKEELRLQAEIDAGGAQ